MDALAFSPLSLRKTLLKLIDEEIEFARAGKPAGIWIKLNSLVDEELIDARIARPRPGEGYGRDPRHLLRPGVPGLSGKISASSRSSGVFWSMRTFAFSATAMPCRAGTQKFSSARPMG